VSQKGERGDPEVIPERKEKEEVAVRAREKEKKVNPRSLYSAAGIEQRHSGPAKKNSIYSERKKSTVSGLSHSEVTKAAGLSQERGPGFGCGRSPRRPNRHTNQLKGGLLRLSDRRQLLLPKRREKSGSRNAASKTFQSRGKAS